MKTLTSLFCTILFFIGCQPNKKENNSFGLVQLKDFEQFGVSGKDTSTIVIDNFLDGTQESTYTFQTPDFYITNTLSNCSNEVEARKKHRIYISQVINSTLVVERLDTIYPSDSKYSLYLLINDEGQPFGNTFVAMKNSSVLFFTVSGIFFKDKKEWYSLLKSAGVYQPSSDK